MPISHSALPEPESSQPSPAFRHLPDCFGCGSENSAALGITLATTPDGAEGRARFAPQYQGVPGLVHGGVLVTLLDETMGLVPFAGDEMRVTAEMTVRYRRPTPIETELVCAARIGDHSDRRFSVRATITTAQAADVVLVEAEATYVLLNRRLPG